MEFDRKLLLRIAVLVVARFPFDQNLENTPFLECYSVPPPARPLTLSCPGLLYIFSHALVDEVASDT